MKQLFLVFACAALACACSGGDDQSMSPRYLYTTYKTATVDNLTVDIVPNNPGHGGLVMLSPVDEDFESPTVKVYIVGADPQGNGRFHRIVVCGYLHRHDNARSHCSTLNRTHAGWDFQPSAADKDMLDAPSQAQIDTWITQLNRGLKASQTLEAQTSRT